jgi:hypothetical protein
VKLASWDRDFITLEYRRPYTQEAFNGEFLEDELGYSSEARPRECP